MAILTGPAPRCPNFGGIWHVNSATGEAVPGRCMNRWCQSCSRLLAIEDGYRIARGIHDLRERGLRIRFFTLTDDSAAALDSKALASAWQRFSNRLRRRGKLGPYAKVIEVQERGALHLHVLMAGGEDGYILQRELSELAVASGFGPIADIRELKGDEGVASIAAYLTKPPLKAKELAGRGGSIAGYLTKQQAAPERVAHVRERFGARVRPVAFARSWPAPTQAVTRKLVREHFKERAIEAGTYVAGEWRTVTELETVLCIPILRAALAQVARDGLVLSERFQMRPARPQEAVGRSAEPRGPPEPIADAA